MRGRTLRCDLQRWGPSIAHACTAGCPANGNPRRPIRQINTKSTRRLNFVYQILILIQDNKYLLHKIVSSYNCNCLIPFYFIPLMSCLFFWPTDTHSIHASRPWGPWIPRCDESSSPPRRPGDRIFKRSSFHSYLWLKQYIGWSQLYLNFTSSLLSIIYVDNTLRNSNKVLRNILFRL